MTPPEPAPDGLHWHRPHPFTVVAEIGRSIRSFIPAIIAVQGDFVGGGMVAEILVAVLPLTGAIGRWWTTRYAVDVEALHHHYGLIWRKRQVLPRANIQNLSTRAGLVARVGSVVELQVSDASADGEISIRYVTAEEAERLTALLRNPTRGPDGGPPAPVPLDAGAATNGPAGRPVERPPLVEVATPDLIRTEATSLAALAPLPGLVIVQLIVYLTLSRLEQAGIGPPEGPLPWAVGSMVVPLLAGLAHVVSRVVAVGDFRLVADPDRLRIRVGLLTEARVTARRERVQQIRVIRQIAHRRLGIERVEYETADTEMEDATATGYLSPTGPAGGWVRLAEEVFGRVEPSEDELRPVSPLTRRRVMVRFALATVPLTLLATALHPALGVALAAAGIAGGWWYSRERHRVLGWALTDHQLLIRRGVLDQTLTLVRTSKIQSLRLQSTYFQRRLGLVTLRLSTAGRGDRGLVTLPDLTSPVAEELLVQLAGRAAATPIGDTL